MAAQTEPEKQMKISQANEAQKIILEIAAIQARLLRLADEVAREDAESSDAAHLRLAADYVGNSLGRLARTEQPAFAQCMEQTLAEMEAADPMVFSNERCR